MGARICTGDNTAEKFIRVIRVSLKVPGQPISFSDTPSSRNCCFASSFSAFLSARPRGRPAAVTIEAMAQFLPSSLGVRVRQPTTEIVLIQLTD
jgi:hypothetical protein